MKHAVILLAWWFITVTRWTSSSIMPMTLGPFPTQGVCTDVRAAVIELNINIRATGCWSDGRP